MGADGGAPEAVAITQIKVLDSAGRPKPLVGTFDDLTLRFHYRCDRSVAAGAVEFEISGADGSKLVRLSTQPDGALPLRLEPGEHWVECRVRQLPLPAGEYMLSAGLAIPGVRWLWRREQVARLTVGERDVYGSGMPPSAGRCLVAMDHSWVASGSGLSRTGNAQEGAAVLGSESV